MYVCELNPARAAGVPLPAHLDRRLGALLSLGAVAQQPQRADVAAAREERLGPLLRLGGWRALGATWRHAAAAAAAALGRRAAGALQLAHLRRCEKG